jgi:small subunit ribosomal protein S8
MSGKPSIEVPYTKESEEVAKNLRKAGFLENVKVFKEENSAFKKLHIDLVFENGISKITDVKRISKPGRRMYSGYKDLRRAAGGFGVTVVSTSRGVMDSSEARKKKLGGEVICEVQ